MSIMSFGDDDLFRKLSAGAHFSRKDTVKLRKEKEEAKKHAASRKKESDDGAADSSLPMELDFFSSASGGGDNKVTSDMSHNNEKKKRKVSTKPVFASPQEMHAYRKKHHIRVYGEDVPEPIRRFQNLLRPEYGLSASIVDKLMAAGLRKPTAVQKQGTPVLLKKRDAFVIAPTGSGKTLVYILSLLTQLMRETVDVPDVGRIQAVIVSPTRELASQIKDEFRKYTPISPKEGRDKPIVGSVLLNKAVVNSWESKAPVSFPAILITTPKRLVQAIEKKVLDLSRVKHIILDEADKLLDLGLMEQMDDILAACTYADGPIQKALVSATIPTGVEELAKSFMNEDPIRVVVGAPNGSVRSINQQLIYVGQEEGKLMAIRQMLIQGLEPPVIIFAETIDRAQELFQELVTHGINVDIIHSERTQAERERIIAQFRAGRIWFLITTELLARGLDFPEVACVINYDFPKSTASYIHRIGRTGRAGKKGKAITLYTREDVTSLKIVANVMKQSGCKVPDWMSNVASLPKSKLKKIQQQ